MPKIAVLVLVAAMLSPGVAPAQKGGLTAEQAYIQATLQRIQAIVDTSGKMRTPAEAELIKTHWRVALRLVRLEQIARSEKDAPTAARAEAELRSVDVQFYARLIELAARAPVRPNAK